MANRTLLSALLGCLLLMACDEKQSGPIAVSGIGAAPKLQNPNLEPLDPPSAFLVAAVAQGLVRFDASGQIEPALAQSWIVSDDGLRYTFRLARGQWPEGSDIKAEQVAARLRAAASRSSKNALKPLLGAIDEIVAMTDEVLEISMKSPRPNFLQLLAQPEMAVIVRGWGAGPLTATAQPDGSMLLAPRPAEEGEAEGADQAPPPVILRGEPAALAVARFAEREADLVIGGGIGDLPLARAADLPGNQLVFDPVAGLFGLAFTNNGRFAEPGLRNALSMAIDRAALVAALGVPGLEPLETLLPPGVEDVVPTLPAWGAAEQRRAEASRAIGGADEETLEVRVAMPEGPGYRLIFAHLQRDWAAIGVRAERARDAHSADLILVDAVAPAPLASWYLRRFSCEQSPVCDPAADAAMAAARRALNSAERVQRLSEADRLLAALVPYIPISAPTRWSLVGPRLNGFKPNMFGRHPAGELIAGAP